MNTIAIIGGGITGLTAAYRLQQKGARVTLYEAGARAGGAIQSVSRDGFLAEFGPNSILETSPLIGNLIRDLGLEGRRLYSNPQAEKRYTVRSGQPVALPATSSGFFTSPLFSLGAKLRLIMEPFIPVPAPDTEESIASFVRRRLGQEFLDYAINPFVAGVYAGDPEQLSVQQAFPKLGALEQRYRSLIVGQYLGARERKRSGEISKQNAKKISFDQGLQVLTDALQEDLGPSVRLHTPVTAVARADYGWTVTSQQNGVEETLRYDAVLLAAPAHRLARIQLNGVTHSSFAPLGDIEHPSVTSVVLGFRREDVAHPLDGFGMLIPEVEKFNILGTLFSSSLFPGRAPAGHVTLTSYVGGTRAPGLAGQPDDVLVKATLEDLRRLLGVKGQPVFQHLARFPLAIPQYNLGFGHFRDLMDRLETNASGIFLAGHFRDGISLGDSIVSGHRAVDRIEQFFARKLSRETMHHHV